MMDKRTSEIEFHLKNLLACDAYKLSHRLMYPQDTQNLYSMLTARGVYGDFKEFVWNHDFAKEILLNVFNGFVNSVIEVKKNKLLAAALTDKLVSVFNDHELANEFTQHICHLASFLEKNKKMPLVAKIHESDQSLPFRTPLITIEGVENIPSNFVWLVNYFETVLLENIWLFQTASTVAKRIKSLLEKYAKETADETSFINFQCHDFSMRGMSSLQSALYVARAHLQYFTGSDTILGGDNSRSILASEHSVMCADGSKHELKTFQRLLEKFKDKKLSLVIDSYDMWNVLYNIIPRLKNLILMRDATLYLRADSGNYQTLICNPNYKKQDKSTWAMIDYLDHHFSSTINKKGYKVLNNKIGIIYGDGITYQKIEWILNCLKNHGYCSSNIIFGVGSSTYQNLNRDTLGFVYKLTAIKKSNRWIGVKKTPITDLSKSSKGGRYKTKRLITVY